MVKTRLHFILIIASQLFVIQQSYITAQISVQNTWQHDVVYCSVEMCEVYEQPSEDAEVIDNISFLSKLVVVRSPYDRFGAGWSRLVYPVKGFVRSKYLVSNELEEIPDTELRRRIEIRTSYESWGTKEIYSETDYAFVKETPDYTSKNIGVIKDNEKVLIITDGQNENNLWIKTIYPVEGYVMSADFSVSGGTPVLRAAVQYGVVNIPYEKNLDNDFNPLGGMLEFSMSDWDFGIRAGYNHSQAHLKKYTLKTDLLYLQLRWTFLRFFDDNLETYAAAGGGYWWSSFQNLKYESLKNYFTEEKDAGPGYTLSAGALYKYYNFYLDVQYFFLGTRSGSFGKEPGPGEFTNLYEVYPAATHVNIFLGYIFLF